MNSLARFDKDQVLSTLGMPLGSVGAAAQSRHRVTYHSGLPVRWKGEGPERGAPAPTGSLLAKRIMDIVLSLIAIAALLPLFILVSLMIVATSKGPVLFRQTREGLRGRPFSVFKFRSMRTDMCDLTGVAQTVSGDPRVTAVGRFLRKTSIDELPQLFNVLRGEMSLVGPRPHVPGMLAGGTSYRALVPYYDERLAMPPGITGWAQANGYRGTTADARAARERIDHDIAYVQNFSVWLDMKIMVRTIVVEFITGSGH